MSYLTLKLENSDIVFNKDNQLQLTEVDDIAQNYKVFLETQFQSDFRDPTYGFKLNEVLTADVINKIDLLRLYVLEALLLHTRTESVDDISIVDSGNGIFLVSADVTLKNDEEINVEVEFTIE